MDGPRGRFSAEVRRRVTESTGIVGCSFWRREASCALSQPSDLKVAGRHKAKQRPVKRAEGAPCLSSADALDEVEEVRQDLGSVLSEPIDSNPRAQVRILPATSALSTEKARSTYMSSS